MVGVERVPGCKEDVVSVLVLPEGGGGFSDLKIFKVRITRTTAKVC
jgi:hypothetical protein